MKILSFYQRIDDEINYHPINLDEEIFDYQEIHIFKEVLLEPRKKKKKKKEIFKALMQLFL